MVRQGPQPPTGKLIAVGLSGVNASQDARRNRGSEGEVRRRLVVEDIAEKVVKAGCDLIAEGTETEALLTEVYGADFAHGQGLHLDWIKGSEMGRRPYWRLTG